MFPLTANFLSPWRPHSSSIHYDKGCCRAQCTQYCTLHMALLSVIALAPHWPMHCSRQTKVQSKGHPNFGLRTYINLLLILEKNHEMLNSIGQNIVKQEPHCYCYLDVFFSCWLCDLIYSSSLSSLYHERNIWVLGDSNQINMLLVNSKHDEENPESWVDT